MKVEVKTMNKLNLTMRPCGALAVFLSAVLLVACGDGGSLPLYPDRQFGVSEPELRDNLLNPNGIVVGRGSGLVVSRLEPAGGLPAPLMGDSASIGVDAMWFDVDFPGAVNVDLKQGNSLSVVSQLTVLDAKGEPLMIADAGKPKSSVNLPAGRYQLRFTAATGATEVALGMVWFGGTAKTVNQADLQKVSAGSCIGCNLQGANLSAISLRGVNLADSDLSHALLVRVSGGFTLGGTDIMTIYLDGSAVRGADLSGANLAGTRLNGAYLTGGGGSPANFFGTNLTSASVTDVFLARADLHGASLANADFSRSVLTRANLRGASLANAIFVHADLSGADMTGADVLSTSWTGANLSAVIWTDGHVCAAGSIGACLPAETGR